MWWLLHMMSGEGGSKQLTQNIWRCLWFYDSYHISVSYILCIYQNNYSTTWITAGAGWHRCEAYTCTRIISLLLFFCCVSFTAISTIITKTKIQHQTVYSSTHRRLPEEDIIRTIFSSKQTQRNGRGKSTFVENEEQTSERRKRI